MKIHEYQAKRIFQEYGIPVSTGMVAETAMAALAAAKEIGFPVVLKAQVHTGGRGKAGGIKLVKMEAEAETTARDILNLTIKDLPVRKLLIAPAVEIKTEVYLSLLIDRGASVAVFIGCAEGGVEIEQTAKTNPEKILRLEVKAAGLASLTPEQCLPLAGKLFADPGQANATAEIMAKMGQMFMERDCALVEINPLIVDNDGIVSALDAKVLLDDNALFRQEQNKSLRDLDSEDLVELDAKAAGLSFIRLDGEIGCMVNGAGLAMATMDIIKHFGGEPANFLDVGGSSNPDKVVTAFKMILKDQKVKVILINIFGGITRCDDIANGILAAMKQFKVTVPIVIRLVGTNEKEGRALLAGTEMVVAETLEEGARRAVEMSQGR
ncbi:MAG: ADP-forming succinate--CoA ligase subunit beta [Planctomycetes bacterium]|nr:ADP-forming succinate--CoA ligase subunit beta [Planctomycetota bacterium]